MDLLLRPGGWLELYGDSPPVQLAASLTQSHRTARAQRILGTPESR